MKAGGPSQRALSRADRPALDDYYSWGEQVLPPADGMVESIVDGLPDNPLGVNDPKNPAGNHVVIVAAGDRLGLCGNSGNSDAPHVHMHVQDTPVLNHGNGQNMTFKAINLEPSGKIFQKVDWPLIRGLFVWN